MRMWPSRPNDTSPTGASLELPAMDWAEFVRSRTNQPQQPQAMPSPPSQQPQVAPAASDVGIPAQPPRQPAAAREDHDRINHIDLTLVILIGVAVLTYSAVALFLLMLLCGNPVWLCWVLSLALDAMVVLATRMWLNPRYSKATRRYASCLAIGGFITSVACAGIQHTDIIAFDAYGQPVAPEWLKFAVGAIPTASFGFIVHLIALALSGLAASRRAAQAAPASRQAEALPKAKAAARKTVKPKPKATTNIPAKPKRAVTESDSPSVPDIGPVPDTRPDWITDDMDAKTAMFAYLNRHPDVTGAFLDRQIGIPWFGSKPDYGRGVKREWKRERDQRPAAAGEK